MTGRLVMLRALGLGDLLTGLPAMRAAAAAHPGFRRILLAPAALAPLAHLSGVVDEVVATDGVRRVPPGPPPGAPHAPEVAVNLHGRGPESHRLLLGLRPRRLIAFASPAAGVTGPRWRADEHERERWCRLLTESGIPADASAFRLAAPAGALPAAARGAVIVHPGAAAPARRWPAGRFAVVARRLRAEGHRVVVTGSGSERALAAAVARDAGLPPAAVLAGATDVLALARCVAAARLVVAGDTGIAHLAVALGVPSVTLFGPTPPALWGPPPGCPRHRALWAGATGDPHGGRPDPGLLRIDVGAVVAAGRRAMEAPVPPRGARPAAARAVMPPG